MDGEWMPVVHKYGGQGNRSKGVEVDIHTIFVDNLPESMDPKSLYGIFTNFKVVRDVFIQNKRRKMT
ncbi:hypothetical protein ACSBR2_014982 [Camellia fascicularis]